MLRLFFGFKELLQLSDTLCSFHQLSDTTLATHTPPCTRITNLVGCTGFWTGHLGLHTSAGLGVALEALTAGL